LSPTPAREAAYDEDRPASLRRPRILRPPHRSRAVRVYRSTRSRSERASGRLFRRTRSRAEGDSRSAAKSCGSMKADPADRGPEATPESASVLKLPRNSRRVFVRLGLVEPELAAVSLDTTPLPARHRGVWIGSLPDRERLFPGGDPLPRRDQLRLVAGTN